MYLVNAQEMRELDRRTIEELGLPSVVLMEVAGRAVAQEVKRCKKTDCRVTVLVGHGNNGGDGLVAARHLAEAGYETNIWLVGQTERMADEVRRFWQMCERLSIPAHVYTATRAGELKSILEQSDIIVDSLLGIGLRGEVRSPMREVIQLVNGANAPFVVAVDVPSGVRTDDGAVMTEAVCADCTVTFAFPKWCHYLAPAAERTGECIVVDIGIPQAFAADFPVTAQVTDESYWSGHLRRRPAFSHKGTFGHVLVVGGKQGMSGAPALTARATLKAGAGLVTTAVPRGIQSVVAGHMAEGLTLGLGSERDGAWSAETALALVNRVEHYDAFAVGPGLGRFSGEVKWLQMLLGAIDKPIVLDADALNIVADNLQILDSCQATVVLTPHPGEMARLLKRELSDIEQNRSEVALELAQKTGTVVVLKGRYTVTAFPDGRQFVNTTGTPAMAKGGAGDVLTGIVAAHLAQGLPVDVAVPLAVSLHGVAGQLAAEYDYEVSVLATDIVQQIGPALHKMRAN